MPRGSHKATIVRSAKKKDASKKTSPFAKDLARFGREFHGRGWALGTSGNYSAVLQHEPLRLLINSSGLDKSELDEKHFLEVDESSKILMGTGKP
jgi:ribulose-5-phosphate 4-epimerase/fuculose-1-phosphate aldolase